jgi:hypothetical protein
MLVKHNNCTIKGQFNKPNVLIHVRAKNFLHISPKQNTQADYKVMHDQHTIEI